MSNGTAGAVGLEDMIHIPDLTEAALLANLELRYQNQLIYTYVGTILVAVNPYETLSIYSDELLRTYNEMRMSDLPPHIFAIANEAHYALLNNRVSQCILISGESGAGKTESTKLIVQSLTALSHSHQWVEEQIVEANTVLEAFGNAKTVRNDNSSRFGKFIAVQFHTSGKVLGARITNYLLEKSRVTLVPPEERNFHVFYQLLRGASAAERQQYALKDEKWYRYLANSGTVDNVDDRKLFERLKISLNVVGFKPEQIVDIFKILSAVLLLGNVTFTSKESGRTGDQANLTLQSEDKTFSKVCEFLGIFEDEISFALTRKSIVVDGQSIYSSLSLDKANETRDSLAKMTYSGLFQWIVDTTNSRIVNSSSRTRDEAMSATIGVLDIFGFENFKTNSFEQFCINFANEQLQQHFNRYIFANEQQEYAKEGIDWSKIDFKDNQATLELFTQKHTGLLAVIDEDSGLPNATDATLLEKLHANQKNPLYLFQQKTNKTHFGVAHYAGDVIYTINGFLAKNRDALNPDVVKLLAASSSKVVGEIFASKAGISADTPQSGKMTIKSLKKALHQVSVSSQFHESLVKLLAMLDSSQPHFIRCIKPNEQKAAKSYVGQFVLTQLRYTGLLETVRIRKLGYPLRHVFAEFVTRYGMVTKPMKKAPKGTTNDAAKTLCKEIVHAMKISEANWQLGNEKIFLRNEAALKLNQLREVVVHKSALSIQRVYRAWRVRRIYLRQRKAAKIIQKYTRRMLARQGFLRVRNATNRIRAMWLMYKQRTKYIKQLRSAVLVQKVYRGYHVRVLYKKQRGAILLLEAAIKIRNAKKHFAVLKQQRDLLEETRRRSEEEAKRLKEEQLRKQKADEERIAKEKKVAEERRIAEEKRIADESRLVQIEDDRRRAEQKKQQEERERREAAEKARREQEEKELNKKAASVIQPMQAKAEKQKDSGMDFMDTSTFEKPESQDTIEGNSKYETIVVQVKRPEKGFGMSVNASKLKYGFMIDKVLEGSYSQQLELRVADMIIAINGIPLANWIYAKVIEELRSPALKSITLLRQLQAPVISHALDDSKKKRATPFTGWDYSSDIVSRRKTALNLAWLQDVKQLCPELPKPIRLVEPITADEFGVRRSTLTDYNFVKYAASFFHPKQSPVFTQLEVLTKPLLITTSKKKSNEALATKFSKLLCHFIDPAKFGGDDDDDDKDDGEGNEIDSIVDVVKAIVKLGQKNVELRDEFYSQVCKVVNGNKDNQMSARGWYLMGVCLGCFAPSQAFEPYIEQFILYNGLFGYEHYNWRGLRRLALSPRHRLLPPSRLELAAAIAQAQCSMPVLLANGHSVTIVIGRSTTNADAAVLLAQQLSVPNLPGFALLVNGVSIGDKSAFVMDAISSWDTDVLASNDKKQQQLELSLRKEYFEPNENLPTTAVVVEMVYKQVYNIAAPPQLKAGPEAAVLVLAAQQVIDLKGDLPADHAASLVKSNAFELQAIVIAFKGTAGFEDINSVAKQIAQKATTLKGQFNPKDPSGKALKLEIFLKSKTWPLIYAKMFNALLLNDVQTLKKSTVVQLALGPTSFSMVPVDPAVGSLSFKYLDLTSVASASRSLTIAVGTGPKLVTIVLDTAAEIAEEYIKVQMRNMKSESVYAIAAGLQKVDLNSAIPLLDFKKGDILILTDRDPKSAWWKGCLAEDPERWEGAVRRDIVFSLCGTYTNMPTAIFQLALDNQEGPFLSASDRAAVSVTRPMDSEDVVLDDEVENPIDQDDRLLSYATKYVRTVFAPAPQSTGLRNTIKMTMVGTLRGAFLKRSSTFGAGISFETLDIPDSPLSPMTPVSPKDREPPTTQELLKVISFNKEPITEALHWELDKNTDRKFANEIFLSIMKLMGDYPSKRAIPDIMIAIIEKSQGLMTDLWRDEILLQVVKQTNGNKSNMKRGWDLMAVCCVFLPPSQRFAPVLKNYLEEHLNRGEVMAKWCLRNLKRSISSGVRTFIPDLTEIECIMGMKPIVLRIYFPGGFSPAYYELNLDSLTTAKEAVETISSKLQLVDSAYNGIYRYENGSRSLVPNNAILMDVLQEIWIASKAKNFDAGDEQVCRLEFRKKLFFSGPTEDPSPAVSTLVYLQSLESFREYALASMDDAIEIGALLLRLRTGGDSLPREGVEMILKQIIPAKHYTQAKVSEWVDWVTEAFERRNGLKYRNDILKAVHKTFTQSQFFGCAYFDVNQIYDQTMPAKVTLAINQNNIFVIDTEKEAVLTKYRYGDVASWSASQDRLSMKIGNMVGGTRFIADTDKGAEICALLDSYATIINKQKAKANTGASK